MALDTQFPQWLSNQQAWTREDDSRFTQSLVQDYFEGQKLGMEKQQQQINLQSGLLGIQQQKQTLALNDVKLRNQTVDSTVIPNWLKDHPTWQSRQDAGGYPTALTPEWETKIDKVRIADTQSVQQKVVLSGVSEFSKRVNDLSKSDPIAGSQFAPYIGKVPPPVVLQALGVAEQAVGVKQQNAKDQAALDAQNRGDVATTTINDKGVSTSYKPAPPQKPSAESQEPKTLLLGNGNTIAWIPGAKTLHVIAPGGSKTEFNVPSMISIAREQVKSTDPKRAGEGWATLDMLGEKGKVQFQGKKPDAATATSQSSSNSPLKVGRFTVIPQ